MLLITDTNSYCKLLLLNIFTVITITAATAPMLGNSFNNS